MVNPDYNRQKESSGQSVLQLPASMRQKPEFPLEASPKMGSSPAANLTKEDKTQLGNTLRRTPLSHS